MSVGISDVLTEVFLDLFQSLQENTRVFPLPVQNSLLASSFQFTIHHSCCTGCSVIDSVVFRPDSIRTVTRNIVTTSTWGLCTFVTSIIFQLM